LEKAIKLIKILTHNHTKLLNKKYVKVVMQIATLEERIRVFDDFGMLDRVRAFNSALEKLIVSIKKEFRDE